ncbi:MAG: class I SAM-dependent methyltransferase, partial [Candidatus Anammoxibacter sp.]
MSLHKAGFDAYGVDIAQDTVRTIRKRRPEIKIEIADVRKLPFSDEYFDGYWSLGVIGHFYDGYDKVFHEMRRIIRGGGYLFLSFPHMSFLRNCKVRRNKYLSFTQS